MSDQRIPDPRSGIGTDLELWHEQACKLCTSGFVVDQVRAAQVKFEADDYAGASLEALKAYWGILACKSMVEKGLELVQDLEQKRDLLAQWALLEQRAKICLHHIDKAPELVAAWKRSGG